MSDDIEMAPCVQSIFVRVAAVRAVLARNGSVDVPDYVPRPWTHGLHTGGT